MIRLSCAVVVAAVLSCTRCQYEYRPDVTFGEMNDRFDVSEVMRSLQSPVPVAHSDSDVETRRHMPPQLARRLLRQIQDKKRRSWRRNSELNNNTIQNARRIIFEDLFPQSRRNNLRSVEDVKGSDRDELVYKKPKNVSFKRRLEEFVQYLHDEPAAPDGPKASRRLADAPTPEEDILLHYGFPFHLKLKGFLQPRMPQ